MYLSPIENVVATNINESRQINTPFLRSDRAAPSNESIDLSGGMKSNPLNNNPNLPNINSDKSAQMITERSNPPS